MNLPHLQKGLPTKAQKAYTERKKQATIDYFARQRMLKSDEYKTEAFLDTFTRPPQVEDLGYFPERELSDDVLDLLP
jgi:hypothetical protein